MAPRPALFLACLALAAPLTADDAGIPPEIENEQALGINKQPYHATLMPYAAREALGCQAARLVLLPQPQRQVEVPLGAASRTAARGFLQAGVRRRARWKEIPVPSMLAGAGLRHALSTATSATPSRRTGRG